MKHLLYITLLAIAFTACKKTETAKPVTVTPPNYDTTCLGHYNLTWTSDIPSSGIGVADLTYKDVDHFYMTANSNFLKSFDSLTVTVNGGFLIIEPQKAINQGWPHDTVTIVGTGSMIGASYFVISYSCAINGNTDYFDLTGQK